MYAIKASTSVKKDYQELLGKLSPAVKTKVENTLKNNPHPVATHGETLCKVKRKGSIYAIEPTGGDRILYDIIDIENSKYVLILCAGNHDKQIRFLKGLKKRK